MADGDIVLRESVTVSVSVREWAVNGGVRYDWITSSGEESDELYDDPDVALDEGIERVQG